uniref:Secreted protein n=1 Tax=Anopheles farauti TaxID=69004 RepID=A0A182Q3N1_9DIPT
MNLITRFVWSALAMAATTVWGDGMPESADKLDACGQHLDELAKASKQWHDKSCEGQPSRPACVVPAHEKAYQELKERCKRAHEQRDANMTALFGELPALISDVNRLTSQLGESLRSDLPQMEAIVEAQKQQLQDAWRYGGELQRELMLTSMESDRMERALLLHSMLANVTLSEMVRESYRYHGGNARMVARMLKFVRLLPAAEERTLLYQQLAELLQTNGQNEQYPAVIFSSDVRSLKGSYEPDHSQYEGKAVARWQTQLLGGNFTEVRLFAHDHPEYFAGVEDALLGALKQRWSLDGFKKMIGLPHVLPTTVQRIRAVRALLEALLAHQTEQHNDAYLMQLAHELAALGANLPSDDSDASRTVLDQAKQLFGQFAYKRDFTTYAELYNVFKAAL